MSLPQNLSDTEIRVLGALIEKELSTPDNYPLSLNSLTGACNQSSNREPVMSLDETTVTTAVNSLRRNSLVRSFQSAGSRVPKYRHLLAEDGELSRAELAVLSVLMLRGPQTGAEIRSRASRLVPEEPVDNIDTALESLIARTPAAAARLERQPGQKESRITHLLGGDVSSIAKSNYVEAERAPRSDRLSVLESQIEKLTGEVADLRAQFAEFRRQLE